MKFRKKIPQSEMFCHEVTPSAREFVAGLTRLELATSCVTGRVVPSFLNHFPPFFRLLLYTVQ